MKKSHLEGRRYIKLVRCSKDEQADTSPEDQSRVLEEFAMQLGMVHAGEDEVLEGVSGSVPAARSDIDRIVARKQQFDDFDVLLLQDFSRFTRGGIEHGNALKWELAKANVEVIFVTSGSTGDADQDGLVQSVGFYAAQQQAKSMSYNSLRGLMSSRAAGNIAHTLMVPYGIDRLYVGMDGKERYRIRNMADGTQQMLHSTKETILRTFERNPKKGAPKHYVRQSDEQIVFVPGAAERVEIVRRIFKEKLVDGDGSYRIAKRLNNEGIRSMTDKIWGKDSIDSILHNSTYVGIGISGRYDTGLYNVLGEKAAPKAVTRELTTIARRKKGQKTIRPRDEWRLCRCPRLDGYLCDLRELAIDMQEREFQRQDRLSQQPEPKKKPGGDKHLDSPFILKGVLRSKQGNRPMTGRRAGSAKKPIRYYAVSRGLSAPMDGSPFAKMIPAEPLERAVVDVVKKVLRDIPNLRKAIRNSVEKEQRARDADQNQLNRLLDEQAQLREQITDVMALGKSIRRLMNDKFQRWGEQALALEERIIAARASATGNLIDVDAVIGSIERQFKKWANSFDEVPPASIRKLLGTLISHLEIDLLTREVHMELSLPHATAFAADEAAPMCLDKKALWPFLNEAHRLKMLKIALYQCENKRQGRSSCFLCRRKAA